MLLELVRRRAYNRRRFRDFKYRGSLMNSKILVTGLCFYAVFVSGCGKERSVPVEPVCTTTEQVGAVVATAEDVLVKMNFVIDKADAKQGYVRTQPLTGAQSFEFWRKDTVGSFNKAEANLQTVRRTVEINVGEKNGQVCADCSVTVERMSLPEREAALARRAAGAFGGSRSALQRLNLNAEQQEQVTWMPLGRDSLLEAEILNRLKARL
jgi:hypothetical protein